MALLVGTGSCSHAQWKGNLYPEKTSQKKMLEFYSQHFLHGRSQLHVSYAPVLKGR